MTEQERENNFRSAIIASLEHYDMIFGDRKSQGPCTFSSRQQARFSSFSFALGAVSEPEEER